MAGLRFLNLPTLKAQIPTVAHGGNRATVILPVPNSASTRPAVMGEVWTLQRLITSFTLPGTLTSIYSFGFTNSSNFINFFGMPMAFRVIPTGGATASTTFTPNGGSSVGVVASSSSPYWILTEPWDIFTVTQSAGNCSVIGYPSFPEPPQIELSLWCDGQPALVFPFTLTVPPPPQTSLGSDVFGIPNNFFPTVTVQEDLFNPIEVSQSSTLEFRVVFTNSNPTQDLVPNTSAAPFVVGDPSVLNYLLVDDLGNPVPGQRVYTGNNTSIAYTVTPP